MVSDRIGDDFIASYLQYTSNTEVPVFFNRWSCMAMLGAILGRQFYIKHGHFSLHPNLYTMLIGTPGTRKSTAIKTAKFIACEAGYNTIAADKTTKEKFLLDLAGTDATSPEDVTTDSMMDINLWGDDLVADGDTRECFIAADEFNDFFGNGNLEFISLLGTLWDFSGVYRNRIKNGKSVSIPNPTISILGGNTPTGFSLAFPTEILGQGFFSRLLLIYGEPNGKKIAFPSPPSASETAEIVKKINNIKSSVMGEAILEPDAKKLLNHIYTAWTPVDDVRFESYSNRRFTHLLKLCLITSASRCSSSISEYDVVYANTVLSHTEHLMPRALGEFGKAKHADVSHKVIQVLEAANAPMTVKEIWKHVHNDLEKLEDLAGILNNLQMADKVQVVLNKGFLTKKKAISIEDSGTVHYDFLTPEEKGLRK